MSWTARPKPLIRRASVPVPRSFVINRASGRRRPLPRPGRERGPIDPRGPKSRPVDQARVSCRAALPSSGTIDGRPRPRKKIESSRWGTGARA